MNTQLNQSVAILMVTANVFLISCSEDKKVKEQKTREPVAVQLGTPVQSAVGSIAVSGQVESVETATISTRMMGFISSIKVKPGDVVQKGQLLVTISNGDVLAKRAQAQAMISEAESSLHDAQKDYERFEQLYKQHSASEKEFENATLRYNSVRAKAEAARQVKNEADEALSYTNLVAPFSGVVIQKNSNEGSMASPGMPILMMERSSSYHVRAAVAETEVGKLRNGMPADVRIKSTGVTFRGWISEISPSAQFTGGQFMLKVTVPPNQIKGLFSGMHVSVNIPLEKPEEIQSPYVPVSALIEREQLSGLYTVGGDQTAQLRWVKVGKRHGNMVEILSGLSADEKFILQSEGKLYSGAPLLVK